MGKPHKHAELIKAWADGAEIEYWHGMQEKWFRCNEDGVLWRDDVLYRIKPERVYPETSMTEEECKAIYYATGLPSSFESGRALANAAIKRHIQGQEASQ